MESMQPVPEPHDRNLEADLPDQTPPEGFEPQVDPGQENPGMYERPVDLIDDAEDLPDDEAVDESGDAEGDDDDAEDSDTN